MTVPIESKNDLIAHLETGCRPKREWRIGTEHEKIGFIANSLRPLPYAGECSISAIFTAMQQRFGWLPVYEDDNIIALKRDHASITLEPGGQLELSGAPLTTIHQTCAEVRQHLCEVRSVADNIGASFLNLGFSPLWSLEETPIMPKARYRIMRNYMQKVGRLGHQMMFRSATVQTNLDFSSEADMVEKMRISLALQPLATVLFANSPFADGRPNGFLSYRSHVWTDTDPDRTGMLPFIFEDGFGFERYVDFALDVPMYFVCRNGKYLDCSGMSFRDFLAGELPALPGEKPSITDFNDHLSTIFPEIRLKTFIEMRGADAGPWSNLCALPALWVGLLYDDQARAGALELIENWSYAECEAMRLCAPVLGLATPAPGGVNMLDIARRVLTIAASGLKRRACACGTMADESEFLLELEDIAGTGILPSHTLLRKYHGEWQGNIKRAFSECIY